MLTRFHACGLAVLLVAALLGGAAVLAGAPDETPLPQPGVEIEEVWARPALQGGNSAVYLKLTNNEAVPLVLVGARSSVARITEVHETVHEHDHEGHGHVMHMEHLHELVIAPGETVAFVPGGLHVMLIELERPLRIGDRIEVELFFAERAPVTVEAIVMIDGDD